MIPEKIDVSLKVGEEVLTASVSFSRRDLSEEFLQDTALKLIALLASKANVSIGQKLVAEVPLAEVEVPVQLETIIAQTQQNRDISEEEVKEEDINDVEEVADVEEVEEVGEVGEVGEVADVADVNDVNDVKDINDINDVAVEPEKVVDVYLREDVEYAELDKKAQMLKSLRDYANNKLSPEVINSSHVLTSLMGLLNDKNAGDILIPHADNELVIGKNSPTQKLFRKELKPIKRNPFLAEKDPDGLLAWNPEL